MSEPVAPKKRQTVTVGEHVFGRDFILIAGPCAVESLEQTVGVARLVRDAGAHMLRGGAYKPRTSPRSFQGLGEEGLKILSAARKETGLPIVTEVMDARDLDKVAACADVLQVGSRNMQNFTLLRELGQVDRPVLLKRGMSATLAEWLSAADYILDGGNERVILCERGIRTFETSTRNTLDLSIVPAARKVTPLPVIVDPSHGTGRADLVRPMSLAAAAVGADGLLIEVHTDPKRAESDRDQQLTPEEFAQLAREVTSLVRHLGRERGMRRSVLPSRIEGTIAAPPSKSVMLRVTAAALLADGGPARLTNPSFCDDARSALKIAEALGANVTSSPSEVVIEGGLKPRTNTLDCGESGLCLRMFTAVSALWHEEITLTGREPLLRRPATAVECPSEMLGATCRTNDGHPPIVVRGPLLGGRALVDGALSSQFLSGLLLALPQVEEDSTLLVNNLTSRPYVDLTLALLEEFGVVVEREDYRRFFIPGGQRISVGDHHVEGDWSAAAFLFVLGAIGGRLRVTGLDPNSLQADRKVLDVLEDAGVNVIHHPDGAEVEESRLRAFSFDLTDAPDLLPPLAALACRCEGTSVFHGVGRLRHKECDRTDAVASELDRLGVRVTTGEDRLEIRGGPVDGGQARAHGDHRIAMALATAGVAAHGPVSIDGAEHVAKSYPDFFTDLVAAGGQVS